MHIVHMEVENYRNFRHIRLVFDSSSNYLVGQHRIGKTNFLALLAALHEEYGFRESDFMDKSKPIRIFLSMQMEAKRTLLFQGRPLDDQDGLLHLEVTQKVEDLRPQVRNMETDEILPPEWLRCIRYLRHIPLRLRRKGVSAQEKEQLRKATEYYFAQRGEKAITLLQEMATRTGVHSDLVAQLTNDADSWLDFLTHGLANEREAGQTFRELLTAGFQLLGELLEMRDSQAVPWEENLIIDGEGRRYLPLLVSIDEPEIHLHPYLQRALLDFYRQVLLNRNQFMTDVLTCLLQIDGLEGQLFIVTNSTDCLINDYRNIIRLYRDKNDEVQAACGVEFVFDADVEKHLVMHFPEIKEALYARSVLVVEGETEYGSFRGFGKTLGVHFDYLGICLINARGESSIAKIMKLLDRFQLASVALYDDDVHAKTAPGQNIFFTEELCYELDIVKTCLDAHRRDVLDQVIQRVIDGEGYVSREMVRKAAAKWKPDDKRFFNTKKLKNISGRDYQGLEFYYFAWLYGNKGVIVGRALADCLDEELIPEAFRRVIERVATLAREEHVKGGHKYKNE